jgi:nitroreductase
MNNATEATAHRIIELACRAPSVHNTQPWRWRIRDRETLELYADRGRQLLVSDPTGRNLALSCGAAVDHATVGARALGLTPTVELEPTSADGDFLARITLTPGVRTAESAESLRSLGERRTDRRRFTSWPVPDSRLLHLTKATAGSGAHAFPITSVTARFCTEELLTVAMAAQASDPRHVAEQAEWIARGAVDGMPMAVAAPLAHGRPATHPNRFASAAQAAAIETADHARVIESSDGLMAVCTARDDQRSWLSAGRALSAMWLRATHEGLSIVPLSQVIEVEEAREALHQKVFDGLALPQILLRVGWLEATRSRLEPTARRPVDELIDR